MFYDNLKQACKDNHTTVTATLKQIGIGTANGTYWKNGSVPASDIVVKLAEFLDVTTDYLLIGKGASYPSISLSDDEQMLLSHFNDLDDIGKSFILGEAKALAELRKTIENDKSQKALKSLKKRTKETVKIDLFRLPVSAGFGVYLDSDDKEEIEVERGPVTEEADFALCVSGNSMEPVYSNGDILLIRSQPTVQIGEVGIFVLNGEGYVKKLGRNRLISLNDDYQDIVLSENDSIWCMGKVLGAL